MKGSRRAPSHRRAAGCKTSQAKPRKLGEPGNKSLDSRRTIHAAVERTASREGTEAASLVHLVRLDSRRLKDVALTPSDPLSSSPLSGYENTPTKRTHTQGFLITIRDCETYAVHVGLT
eukprot:scaffold3068_cov269-Pinguiococcus_pyrenoidosus.AAC.1